MVLMRELRDYVYKVLKTLPGIQKMSKMTNTIIDIDIKQNTDL